MPKALDQEHKSALSMSARPVSFATLKTYTTRRDTTMKSWFAEKTGKGRRAAQLRSQRLSNSPVPITSKVAGSIYRTGCPVERARVCPAHIEAYPEFRR
jgi:hypothetical protein